MSKEFKFYFQKYPEQLKIVSQDFVSENKIAAKDIFYIKANDDELGPFYKDDLQKFLKLHPDVPYATLLKNAQDKKWDNIYEHPYFTRRKTKNSALNDIQFEDKDFYYLVDGIKNGPIPFNELQEKIENKQILLTSSVSFDQGSHWYKICELPVFDRRNNASTLEQLPFMPEDKTFTSVNITQLNKTEPTKKSSLFEIASLGLLKKESHGKKEILNDNHSQYDQDSESNQSLFTNTKVLASLAITFICLGVYFIPENKVIVKTTKFLKKKEAPKPIKASPPKRNNASVQTFTGNGLPKVQNNVPQKRVDKPNNYPARRATSQKNTYARDNEPIYDDHEEVDLFEEENQKQKKRRSRKKLRKKRIQVTDEYADDYDREYDDEYDDEYSDEERRPASDEEYYDEESERREDDYLEEEY